MQPTIQPGDVVLVEKVTPRLRLPLHTGDIVFFEPPEALKRIVRERQRSNAVVDPSSDTPGLSRPNASDADGVVVATPREKVVDQVPPFFQKRELFVKRVTALPGDGVDVDRQGTVTIAGFYSGRRGQGLSSR